MSSAAKPRIGNNKKRTRGRAVLPTHKIKSKKVRKNMDAATWNPFI